ncbi:MAG: redox-sensing transcriptional repressor Rex [Candidatus Sumerlaeia bacterium]
MFISNSPKKNIHPIPSIRRLPHYLRFLKADQAHSRTNVSCTQIARALELDPTQVRKDLSITGIVGRPRVGYNREQLAAAIEKFLGWQNASDAFLVGAGGLGASLLGDSGPAHLPLNVVGVFDMQAELIGKRIGEHEVLPMDRLPDLAFRMHVSIGVLAVAPEKAQEATDVLVGSGIRAIWNLTPGRLEVPENFIIEHLDFSSSLAVLSARLQAMLKS